jgi:hypothetical protein
MSSAAIGQQTEELSYDERMDRLVAQLSAAASRHRANRRKHVIIALAIMVVLGVAMYFARYQGASGGEFMHFLSSFTR